jgi:hypothetical protein
MKRPVLIPVLAGCASLLFLSFVLKPAPGPAFPEEVEKVLKASCYDCHSSDASNKRAPIVLNFDKWDDYKVTRKISKLEAVCEMVDGGKMPPEKYLKSNPDKALSDAQKETICDWTGKESDKLMEGIDE